MVNRWKVLVTSNIPEAGLDMLREECEIDYHQPLDQQITETELIEAAKSYHAIITLLTDPVTESVAEAAVQGGKLKIIANYGAGFDNIALSAFQNTGIRITNTPGVLHNTTADLAFSLILGVARRLREAENYLRQGKFQGWRPDLMLGDDVHHKTLGIIGLGEIGSAVARRAKGFDMKVLYHKQTPLSDAQERKLGVSYASKEELLRSSDFISLHIPLSDKTRHLIGAEEFKMMKDSAYLINTARGPVVDESALVEALEQSEIAGAALDVFEEEPKVHAGLLNREDCLLVPHIGSATKKCRDEMAEVACKNVKAVLEGAEPPTPVQ